MHSYWWFLGLPVVFDIFITKKVKWAFWKKNYKEGEKRNVWLDWLDAMIFAVIVVTFINIFFLRAYKIPSSSMESSLMTGDFLFVSNIAYGPRMPETPLSVPFMHNVFPASGKECYSKAIKWKYRRLSGFGKVERDDYVVFNFPNGDTVLHKAPSEDYYTHVRMNGRDYTISEFGPLVVRPKDKEDHYVKRCVAIAGDTLHVINGVVFVNGEPQENYPGIQNTYTIITDGTTINYSNLKGLGTSTEAVWFNPALPGYPYIPLNKNTLAEAKKLTNVVSITANVDKYPPDYPDSPLMLFPFVDMKWTKDNYGPIWIPKRGEQVTLTMDNLPLYQRIITNYEHNTLEIKDNKFIINGVDTDTYIFKQDYYFMMGDNRHNSLDSRYWGFVPEDHIVGKPSFIWFSSDNTRRFPNNIRWNRLLRFVK